MEQLRDQHGHDVVDRALRHLSIRLRSRPESAPFAAEIDDLRGMIRSANDVFLEARETRVAATAELEYLDGELDAGIADLARQALVEVRGKRDDERYRRLFAAAPSDATRPVGGASQERYVRGILAQLTSEASPFPGLREQAAPIEATLTALKEAEQRRADLYVAEATATTERTIALDRARREYNQMHPRLRLLFPRQRRLVESFFVHLRASSGRARPGADEPEPTDEA